MVLTEGQLRRARFSEPELHTRFRDMESFSIMQADSDLRFLELPMLRIAVCIHQRPAGRMSCAGRGSRELLDSLRQVGREGTVYHVFGLACLGECERGIAAKVVGGDMLTGLGAGDALHVLNRLEGASVALMCRSSAG